MSDSWDWDDSVPKKVAINKEGVDITLVEPPVWTSWMHSYRHAVWWCPSCHAKSTITDVRVPTHLHDNPMTVKPVDVKCTECGQVFPTGNILYEKAKAVDVQLSISVVVTWRCPRCTCDNNELSEPYMNEPKEPWSLPSDYVTCKGCKCRFQAIMPPATNYRGSHPLRPDLPKLNILLPHNLVKALDWLENKDV